MSLSFDPCHLLVGVLGKGHQGASICQVIKLLVEIFLWDEHITKQTNGHTKYGGILNFCLFWKTIYFDLYLDEFNAMINPLPSYTPCCPNIKSPWLPCVYNSPWSFLLVLVVMATLSPRQLEWTYGSCSGHEVSWTRCCLSWTWPIM